MTINAITSATPKAVQPQFQSTAPTETTAFGTIGSDTDADGQKTAALGTVGQTAAAGIIGNDHDTDDQKAAALAATGQTPASKGLGGILNKIA